MRIQQPLPLHRKGTPFCNTSAALVRCSHPWGVFFSKSGIVAICWSLGQKVGGRQPRCLHTTRLLQHPLGDVFYRSYSLIMGKGNNSCSGKGSFAAALYPLCICTLEGAFQQAQKKKRYPLTLIYPSRSVRARTGAVIVPSFKLNSGKGSLVFFQKGSSGIA